MYKIDIFVVYGFNLWSKDILVYVWDIWCVLEGLEGCFWLKEDFFCVVFDVRIFLYEYDFKVVFGKDRFIFVDKVIEFLEIV